MTDLQRRYLQVQAKRTARKQKEAERDALYLRRINCEIN